MALSYNFKKGVDIPNWIWLREFPALNYHGASNEYDGVRYVYWAFQSGTTSAAASTTQLSRYDTWTNGWQYLANTTSGAQGLDIEYDPQRNVIYIIHGAVLTSWQVFNLNTTSVTIAGVSCAAWALTTMTPVLTTAASYGATVVLPNWQSVPGAIDVTTGLTPTSGNCGSATAGTGSTTTNLIANTTIFTPGMVGLQVTFGASTTTVALRGKSYIISAVAATGLSATVATMAASPASTDTFIIELPKATATAGAVGTLTDTVQAWPTNAYANCDVVIVSGTGAGQRRRIASNTATVLTLAASVTGNANTGNFSVAPDATSVYQIQPSSDFLYYFVGNNSTTAYKIDISQTTGAAFAAITAIPGALYTGGNVVNPKDAGPFRLLCLRGNATSNVYWYNIGTNAWTTPTVYAGSETFTTGATSCFISGRRKLMILKEATKRTYFLDLTTNILEPAPQLMYAAPVGYDGKRLRFVKTADGVEWVYFGRAGGQEHHRIAIEWL